MLSKILKEYADKKYIKKSVKDVLLAIVEKYSKEEQEENKEIIDKIKNKPENKIEDEKNKTKSNDENKEFSNNHKENIENKKLLAEKLEEIKKLSKELQEKAYIIKEKELSEKFDIAFSLSNDKIGFLETSKVEVIEFLKTLSNEQLDKFTILFSELRKVDCSEYGSTGITIEQRQDADILEKKAQKLSKETGKTINVCFNELAREQYKV